jgi:lambda family phage portal protein
MAKKLGVVARVKTTFKRTWQIMAGGYDAAGSTRFIKNAFKNAADVSADEVIITDLPTLRERANHEIRNNSYAEGIVETMSNDIIGTGPRLQMTTASEGLNGLAEREFSNWMTQVDLVRTLQIAVKEQCGDGEALVLMNTNQSLPGKVKLFPALIDPNRLDTPWLPNTNTSNISMGVEYDDNGVPIAYHIAKKGSVNPQSPVFNMDFERIPADRMVHLYRKDRPGQSRGVPWITPAIPLFAYLRRYTLAVIGAAETAADYAVILQSQAGNMATEDDPEAMDVFDIERGMMMTTPKGWEAKQMKAEQPTDTYKEFKREILNEIARCLNMPYNIAAADSSDYNYASGRLDHQMYFKAVEVSQEWIERELLNVIFNKWFIQARAAGIFTTVSSPETLSHEWMWDQFEHVDPLKEALATTEALTSMTTTYKNVYAAQGKDWEKEFEQRAIEKKKMDLLKLTLEESTPEQQATQAENRAKIIRLQVAEG